MFEIRQGDALEQLRLMPDASVNCCVTSPPYWGLRDYGVAGQIGLESTVQEFLAKLVAVFEEVRRVLTPDGTCWVNMGDCYVHGTPGGGDVLASGRTDGRKTYEKDRTRGREKVSTLVPGLKTKDLLGQPWRLALSLQAAGWYLRSDIIWHKPNPMPESVSDRPTKAHEYLFLFTKSPKYYWNDAEAQEPVTGNAHPRGDGVNPKAKLETGVFKSKQNASFSAAISGRKSVKRGDFNGKTNALPGREAFRAIQDTRNIRDVWTIPSQPYAEAHFATFPPELPRRCISMGCPAGGVVLDPFSGAGTTGLVAAQLGRRFIGIELNPEYIRLAQKRCKAEVSQEKFEFFTKAAV